MKKIVLVREPQISAASPVNYPDKLNLCSREKKSPWCTMHIGFQ
jgi:hypothetical protein